MVNADPRDWSRREFLATTGTAAGGLAIGDVALDGESDIARVAGEIVDGIVPNKYISNLNKSDFLQKASQLAHDVDKSRQELDRITSITGVLDEIYGKEDPFSIETYRGSGVTFGNFKLSTNEAPVLPGNEFDDPETSVDEGRDAAYYALEEGEDGEYDRVRDILEGQASGEDVSDGALAAGYIDSVLEGAKVALTGEQVGDIENLLTGDRGTTGLFDIGLFVQTEGESDEPDYENIGEETLTVLEQARDRFGEIANAAREYISSGQLAPRELNDAANDYIEDLTPKRKNGEAILKTDWPVLSGYDSDEHFLLREARDLLSGQGQYEDLDGDNEKGLLGLKMESADLIEEAAGVAVEAAIYHDVISHVVEEATGQAQHYEGGEFDSTAEPRETPTDTATETPTDTPTETPTATSSYDAKIPDSCQYEGRVIDDLKSRGIAPEDITDTTIEPDGELLVEGQGFSDINYEANC